MKSFLCILIVALTLGACSSPYEGDYFLVDGDYLESGTKIMVIDTFTVKLSNFKIDSIVTSGTDRLLFGQYDDEYFGRVRAESFFQMYPSSYSITDGATLDSVALILGYDKYYYGDTLQPVTLNIHKVIEKVKPANDDFYNTSSIAYNQTPITQVTVAPRPLSGDSIHVTLPNSFGAAIFNAIEENQIDEFSDFEEVFKGLTIQPELESNTSILGISKSTDDTYLRFYYSLGGEVGEDSYTFDLKLSQGDVSSYNKISSTNSSECLSQMIDQDLSIATSECDFRGVMQSGTGYTFRIDFPTLKNLYDWPVKGTVLSADLTFTPDWGTYNEPFHLQDSLIVSKIRAKNNITGQLDNGEDYIYANRVEGASEFELTSYNVALDGYVDDLLDPDTQDTNEGLTFYPELFNAMVDRMIIDDDPDSEYRPKLKIVYAIYDVEN
ncbi:DUF4270 family protein [Mangrovimonas sp. DI 80]|uniref:DUF4270 family protein n=1 Tax=Mangrovimonas sp. DI 80 TaxID=1779330 RepID=UPI000978191B|nr:DUF4270 family protein [Mangrovimonas sp. DI 80]OMP30148.1 hypothetical protein BKM32_12220 [Mangrovimonas sp. DI 80]